ncbi:MAG TPA: hypothetical protein VEF92_09205 [Burkholderiales bacterium]|nr:hypothetical protein [Burkholderiales bacterium]
MDGVIHFKVEASPTDPTPVHGATVELSGSSPSVGDPNAGFVGTLSGGAFLNPSDPNHVFAKTDSSGFVTALYQFTVPRCSAAADLAVTASISASVGGSTAIWTDNITITKDPTC